MVTFNIEGYWSPFLFPTLTPLPPVGLFKKHQPVQMSKIGGNLFTCGNGVKQGRAGWESTSTLDLSPSITNPLTAKPLCERFLALFILRGQ